MISKGYQGWLCLLVLTFAQACSFDLMEMGAAAENRCSHNSECPGATCDMGMCVTAFASSLPITLEVTPASAAYGVDPPTIVLPPFASAGTDDRVLIVPDAVLVFGDVRIDDEPVSATLRFVPNGGAAAVSARSTTATTSASPTIVASDESADYSVPLVGDTEYRVIVTPSDSASLPPLHLRMSAVQASQRFDARYDSARLSTHAVRFADLPTGLWSVVALEPATGEEISTRVRVSSDAPVALLTSAARMDVFDLLVVPTTDAEFGVTASAPTFRVAHASLVKTDLDTWTAQLPLLSRAVTFTGTVEHCRNLLSEPEVLNRPALAVALRSRSLLTEEGTSEISASFTTTATATYDAALREWSFSTQVMAGQYDVVVAPATDSGCGVFAETRAIQAPEANAEAAALLQLPMRSFLSGRVLAGGQVAMPVMGAAVVANALGLRDAIALEPSDDTVTRYNRSQQTTTNMLGEFTLPIDLGAYDVIVKPPAESGFAWHVLRDVHVGARTETPFDREIAVTAPVILRGTLRTPSTALSMAGATVRAYTTTDSAERGQRALPIGAATADADGRFVLLLPANIDRGWY